MTRPLAPALDDVRSLVGDGGGLVRAVATGRRRGMPAPTAERVEIRQVALRSGAHLQVLSRTGPRVETVNAALGPDAAAVVAALLAEPFTTWHVETATETVQLRVTKRGEAQVHRTPAAVTGDVAAPAGPALHDRVKQHLVAPDDPLFTVLGAGADKRRQVDAFVRLLAPSATALMDRLAGREGGGSGDQPRSRDEDGTGVLRVADLGCGNAYLTFAAHRWLSGEAAERGRAVHTVGVDVRADVVDRSRRLAREADLSGLDFIVGTIADADPFPPSTPDPQQTPDVVIALHACDTASDEALARAVRWAAPLVLVAPCCHHDVQRQLQQRTAPLPYPALTRHAILRERFADVLTDAVRALLLRLLGYRVDVMEFIDSRHTPRNAMIRAVRTGAPPTADLVTEYRTLTQDFGVEPALARMLRPELTAVLDRVGAPVGAPAQSPS